MNITDYTQLFLAIALGVGLSASCGFRVFLPLFVGSLGAKLGFLPVTDSFAWLGSLPVLVALGVATIAELIAYYIPFVDNALDTIAGPISVAAGTLLSASFLQIDDPMVKWGLGLIVGGGAAGAIQAGTTATRLASSATTGGVGNPLLTTIEHIFAFFGSLLTIFFPIVAAVVFVIIIVMLNYYIIRYFYKRSKKTSTAIASTTG